jgi:hypothetical protein
MTGIEKSRLKKALENGTITKDMSKKDIYINKLLDLLQDEPKLVKDLIKRIK